MELEFCRAEQGPPSSKAEEDFPSCRARIPLPPWSRAACPFPSLARLQKSCSSLPPTPIRALASILSLPGWAGLGWGGRAVVLGGWYPAIMVLSLFQVGGNSQIPQLREIFQLPPPNAAKKTNHCLQTFLFKSTPGKASSQLAKSRRGRRDP